MRMPNPRNMHIPRPNEIRASIEASPTSGFTLFGYLLSSFLAIIIPVSKWSSERGKYYRYMGQYNQYDQQQQQYENGNNGNYNYNNYNLCKWYDFRCRLRMQRYQQYAQQNGEQGGENGSMQALLPNWFFFFGGQMEGDEREREEGMGMNQNEGSMKFVYAMTIITFVGLTIFAMRSLWAGKDRLGVIVALLALGLFSVMNLLTSVQSISSDGRYSENSVYGWYGQFSVLVAYTDFWVMIHCFGAAAVLGLLRWKDKKSASGSGVQAYDVQASDVQASSVQESSYKTELSYSRQSDSVMTERNRWDGV